MKRIEDTWFELSKGDIKRDFFHCREISLSENSHVPANIIEKVHFDKERKRETE